MYYGLTNYYQNHRRYVRSRDDGQLHGYSKDVDSLLDDCAPFKSVDINSTVTKPIAPCGAIANSLFNGGYFDNVNISCHVQLCEMCAILWQYKCSSPLFIFNLTF